MLKVIKYYNLNRVRNIINMLYNDQVNTVYTEID